jgi:hypothetical protein
MNLLKCIAKCLQLQNSSLIAHILRWFYIWPQFVLLVAHIHPFIPHYHFQCASPLRIQYQKFFEQILAIRGHVEWDTVFPAQNPFTEFLCEGGWEN